MDPFEKISQSLKAHESKAQILLEVEDEGKTLKEALDVLKAHGVHPIEYDVIQKGNSSFVLFYLLDNDMRVAVLKLTEAGYSRLKGLDSMNEVRPRSLKGN